MEILNTCPFCQQVLEYGLDGLKLSRYCYDIKRGIHFQQIIMNGNIKELRFRLDRRQINIDYENLILSIISIFEGLNIKLDLKNANCVWEPNFSDLEAIKKRIENFVLLS